MNDDFDPQLAAFLDDYTVAPADAALLNRVTTHAQEAPTFFFLFSPRRAAAAFLTLAFAGFLLGGIPSTAKKAVVESSSSASSISLDHFVLGANNFNEVIL